MTPQGTFEEIEMMEKVARAKALGCERERLLKGVAASIDRKLLAAYLNVSYSYLSEIINGNNEAGQKPIPHKFVGAIMMLAPDRYMAEVASFDEDVCGYEHPPKKRDLTPNERLENISQVLKKMGMDKHPDLKELL